MLNQSPKIDLLRKEIETEKRERQKQKTMDTLLKKKDSKATKQIKTSKSIRSESNDPMKLSKVEFMMQERHSKDILCCKQFRSPLVPS